MSTPVSVAACSAPALTTSQNESPGFACVMTSTRKSLPAPDPPLLLSLLLSPPPQAAANNNPPTARDARSALLTFMYFLLVDRRGGLLSLRSLRRRETQMREGALADVGPPAGDDLGPGVERDPLGAVDVLVTEQRVLPSPE